MGIKDAEILIREIESNGATGVEEGTQEMIIQLKSLLEKAYPELKKLIEN
jgi:hypothetical protein